MNPDPSCAPNTLCPAGESRVEVALTPGARSSDGKASTDTAVRAAPYPHCRPGIGQPRQRNTSSLLRTSAMGLGRGGGRQGPRRNSTGRRMTTTALDCHTDTYSSIFQRTAISACQSLPAVATGRFGHCFTRNWCVRRRPPNCPAHLRGPYVSRETGRLITRAPNTSAHLRRTDVSRETPIVASHKSQPEDMIVDS